jgi:uncharacterized protein (TIGR02246 family)
VSSRKTILIVAVVVLGIPLGLFLIDRLEVDLAGTALGGGAPAGPGADSPKAKPGEEDTRQADRAAIRKASDAFLKAFTNGDARAVAASWTPEGEFIAGDGSTLRGRAAIEKAYGEFFAKNPRPEAETEIQSLRFVSRDTAAEEGFFKVRLGKNEAKTTSRYSVLHVRENGQWLMAIVREWPIEAASLHDLEWLIGTWSAKREDVAVHTTYEWLWNKSFIRVQFEIKGKEQTHTGFQLIGKDPALGLLRSWTFDSEGGFGEAHWTRDGKKWLLDSAGVHPDGSTQAASILLTPVDPDTFVYHVVSRTIDGQESDTLPPIKITRVKEKP